MDPQTHLSDYIFSQIIKLSVVNNLHYSLQRICTSWLKLLRSSNLIQREPLIYQACTAATLGYLNLLKLIDEENGSWVWNQNNDFFWKVIKSAVEGDQLHCLKYLVDNNIPFKNNLNSVSLSSFVSRISLVSAKYGAVKCLENYFGREGQQHKNNKFNICDIAAKNGHLNCLKFLKENESEWGIHTGELAAQYGHFDCMKYCFENGCARNLNFLKSHGFVKLNFECLKYLKDCGYKLDIYNIERAASNLENLKYMIEHKWEHSPNTIRFSIIAAGTNFECLKYLHENGFKWDVRACIAAASAGRLDCLKYLHENKCEWNGEVCSLAAGKGRLKCLKYAHENGCEWNKYTCVEAARGGKLECLKYAHENGCEWDKYTCTAASRNGELECLKYAHENGCEWDKNTCIVAIGFNHIECVKYAINNGCPFDIESILSLDRRKDLFHGNVDSEKSIQWIIENHNSTSGK